MKETRTARPGGDCPTLLHYLARLLLQADEELVHFINDMPHIEASARSKLVYARANDLLTCDIVSVQNCLTSVKAIANGFDEIKNEIEAMKQRRPSSEDKFVMVMEVSYCILF